MIKAGGKRPQMPGSPGHLRTFSQNRLRFVIAGHMSTEQGRLAAAAGRGANVWSIAGAPKRAAMRALIMHVCGQLPMATSIKRKSHLKWLRVIHLFPDTFTRV